VFVVALAVLATSAVRSQSPPAQPAHHGANPAVSPDGRHIAFLSDRDGAEDIYVMAADGSSTRRLTNVGHTSRPHWSADGRQLVFSVSAGESSRVFAVSFEGGAAAEIARFEARGAPVPVGDGSRFVYGVGGWTEMQLVVSRADGSARKALTSDRAAYWCAGVSPGGDQVAAGRKDADGMQIWMVKTDGSGARQVTRFTPEEGSPQCPAFSPDGRRLAVQAEAGHVGHLWLVDPESGAGTKLATHTDAYRDELPAWFPDGRRLAFQSDRTGRWEIWAMNADGTDVRQITQ
jgi:TolB protein